MRGGAGVMPRWWLRKSRDSRRFSLAGRACRARQAQTVRPAGRKWPYVRPTRSLTARHNELAPHLAVARVARQVRVEREGAGDIGAELDDGRPAGRNAARQAVGVDRQTVRDILALDGQLDEIVLRDGDAAG